MAASDELFRLLVEGVNEYAIALLDEEGVIASWNAGAQIICGYSAAEAIGRPHSMLYPPEALEGGWPAQELEMARRRGRFEDIGWRVRKDGTRLWANVVISALYDSAQGRRGFSMIVRDMTPQKREHESLSASERRFRLLVEGVRDYAIFMLTPEGRVASWNAGAQSLKGYQPSEIIGQHFSVFYPAEAVERHWPEQELKIAEAQGRFQDEGWRMRKDGTRFWADCLITAIKDDQGTLMGFSKITRDLTERRRQEESLRQSEERFRLLVDSVRDYAIFMLDPEGRITSWNQGAERIKGYKPAEIIGRHFSIFYPREANDRGWPQHELEMAKREGRFEDEGYRIRKDGSTFWANVIITALHGRNGELRGFAKITRDLTERRRVEALEHSERRAHEFLAMLAHELRNPLAPIASSLQIVLREPAPDAEGEFARRVMQRQLAQLTRLVDDLLDVSRITKAAIQLRRRPVNLNAVVRSAAEGARYWMDSYGHTLEIHVPSEVVSVDGDEQRLTQVLTNLLHNAAKYTPTGGRIELVLETGQEQAVVRVKDTGVGMSPDLLETVFGLFVQGEQSLARTEGGLGVGLTLVKQLVNLHGGTVEARSAGPDKGSEFVVRLPRLSGAREDELLRESSPPPAAPGTSKRVLIVDDNADAADMLAILLREFGHDVRTARDGMSALGMAEQFEPQFVLLDIGLPEINGYEVARRMRRLPGLDRATYVAITGYGQPSDRAESARAGFAHHLVKPVDANQMLALIGGSVPTHS